MSEKRYQISPAELVRWAEPLVFDEGEAEGFSKEVIASYEAAGIRLPAAFRSYLLACGQAGLNSTLHEMFIPDRNAEPFQHRLTFSYDYIKGDLKWFQEKGEKDYGELARLRALPQQRWSEVTGNYLKRITFSCGSMVLLIVFLIIGKIQNKFRFYPSTP